jgi:hypothetical protein
VWLTAVVVQSRLLNHLHSQGRGTDQGDCNPNLIWASLDFASGVELRNEGSQAGLILRSGLEISKA